MPIQKPQITNAPVKITGLPPIPVIRSDRRTVSVKIERSGAPSIRAPKRMPDADIYRFAADHAEWIKKNMHEAPEKADLLTMDEINDLADRALKLIPERVAYFAPLVGVMPKHITIRNQHTRWGSCSSKGNLNFNCLLMLTPPEVIDSVVVHELCHMKHMDHSRDFYNEVLRVMPDYYERDKWLKANGSALLSRLG